ncbi:hypothetical protein [Halalkalicoccus salilacus]|uniref:hypothetical protein n=1 Tax=Halalkalicoccus TaxID=332246 RepID=UPI002F963284
METGGDMHHCIECDWSTRTDEQGTEHEYNEQAIGHHIETGHTIASGPGEPRTESGAERSRPTATE